MNTYRATFSVMAETRIEIEVTAENQQDGMVAAHDALLRATREQARVVQLNLDSATNLSFDAVSAPAPALPPAGSKGVFRVARFSQDNCGGSAEPESRHFGYELARAQAETVLQAESAYGSACVWDDYGLKVLVINAKRGGWEVLAQSTDALSPPQLFTWIGDRAEARATAMQLLGREGTDFVQIIDYTVRIAGPVLWRQIR